MRVGEDRLVSHNTRKAEITQLHVVVCVEENIAGLQITMQNFAFLPGVARVKSLQNLAQDRPNHIFGQVSLFLTTRADHG